MNLTVFHYYGIEVPRYSPALLWSMQVFSEDEPLSERVEELAAHGVCDRGGKHSAELPRLQLPVPETLHRHTGFWSAYTW